jgi:hypothetical protein
VLRGDQRHEIVDRIVACVGLEGFREEEHGMRMLVPSCEPDQLAVGCGFGGACHDFQQTVTIDGDTPVTIDP